ncbi:uncharacterized protein LOC143697096 [Siphateles boraxobius]|uniref:uncharacterized protein LOC143697096 n=1 Tax=Siphateles boraxobius TaxID=180520 RepID=UPI0040643C0C
MVRKCACPGCPNRQKQPRQRKSALPKPTDERIHFYSFSVNDPERIKLWLLCVQRDVDLPLQIIRLLTLCSEHFSPDDFRPVTGKILRKLKKTAVPSLCLPHTKICKQYVQLSQDTESEGPTPVQGAESESQESQAEKEGNREDFVITVLAGVPQSTPLKSYDRQSSVREAQDSVSKLRRFAPLSSTTSKSTSNTEEEGSGTYKERKLIVNESKLMQLFTRCPQCVQTVIDTKKFSFGSLLRVIWECTNGHEGSWNSCGETRGMADNNLLVAASTLFTGATYVDIADWAVCLNVQIPHKTTFYAIQSSYLIPVVDVFYKEQQAKLLEDLRLRNVLQEGANLLGDRRSDR